jgi:uncharacterized protein YcbK (DUF882 family)
MLLAALSHTKPAHAGDDRTISFFHIHTSETLTIQYKKNGRFLPEALEKINWIMRDWRENKSIAIDPNTIDIIWEMHQELGSQQPVSIICGYRSRGTNEMLRKTRGGQASQSQHITGKAIDIAFPDVPIKRLRYSAMIRERGGVGYYPTSGLPFVHVDTSRVRHWPRMVRDELALLFPSGHSKHEPADGRPITPADVRSARARRKDLAQEVAQFYALRDSPKAPIQVAEAEISAPLPLPPRPARAVRPPAAEQRMAVGAPLPAPSQTSPEAMAAVVAFASERTTPEASGAPKLLAAPKPVERSSTFVAKLPDADRSRLDMLVQLAAIEENARAQSPVKQASLITGSTGPGPAKAAVLKTAAMTPDWPFPKRPVVESDAPAAAAPHPFGERSSSDWRSGWMTAPEYDEDHPDELSYRPFALAPLLTETASFDDPALATMVHPDDSMILELLDDEGTVLPMEFGTGQVQTAMAWAQEFSGSAVHLDALAAARQPQPAAAPPQLVSRAVTTLPR